MIMNRHCFLLLSATMLFSSHTAVADEWRSLFDGKSLKGWRANVLPESFSVVDGAIRAHAPRTDGRQKRSHLFYVGDLDDGCVRFKNFELEATARSEPGSNSGIFIHTDMSTRDAALHLAKGYEVQLNSAVKEKRKTGSLYAVVDLDESPVDETKWFRIRIAVRGKRITVHLNDKQVMDYTEPDDVKRPPSRAGRLLDPEGAAIALQAHDPESIFYFKDIRIRELP